MKRKTPGGIKVLRAVTITLTVLVLLVIGTVVYSAYEDYTGVRPELMGGQGGVGKAVMQGSSEIISINITIPNKGLYTLNVTVACSPGTTNIVCQPSQVSVASGQVGVLHFRMTVVNLQQFVSSSNHDVDGTVAISLEPFATLSIGVNLGAFVSTGGT